MTPQDTFRLILNCCVKLSTYNPPPGSAWQRGQRTPHEHAAVQRAHTRGGGGRQPGQHPAPAREQQEQGGREQQQQARPHRHTHPPRQAGRVRGLAEQSKEHKTQ